MVGIPTGHFWRECIAAYPEFRAVCLSPIDINLSGQTTVVCSSLSCWCHKEWIDCILRGSVVDSSTISMHSTMSRHLPAVRVVQGDCRWPLKNGGKSHCPYAPIMHHMQGIPPPIFRSANHTADNTAACRACQTSTGSLTATRLGLWSSLGLWLQTWDASLHFMLHYIWCQTASWLNSFWYLLQHDTAKLNIAQ